MYDEIRFQNKKNWNTELENSDLHNLHGQPSGTQLLILFLKIVNDEAFLIFPGIISS